MIIDFGTYGKSVRTLFKEDLEHLNSRGICFVPEWICYEMTNAVEIAGWKPRIYRTLSTHTAKIPLQIDEKNLKEQLHKEIQEKNKGQIVALLLAHPFGYVDPTVMSILRSNIQDRKIPIFLDLSQSYGRFDFKREINLSISAYVSFNGNKLISKGGAIRFGKIGNYSAKYHRAKEINYKKLQEIFRTAADRQEKTFLQNIRKIGKSVATKATKGFNAIQKRSCWQRTMVLYDSIDSKDKLKKKGLGQYVHPDPQIGHYQTSNNYLSWIKHGFLLFPYQRKKGLLKMKNIESPYTKKEFYDPRLFQKFKNTVYPRIHRNPMIDNDIFYTPVTIRRATAARLEKELCLLHSAHIKALKSMTENESGFWHKYIMKLRKKYLNDSILLKLSKCEKPQNQIQFVYGRPDILLSEEGFKIAETNFDVGIGGFDMSTDLQNAVYEIFHNESNDSDNDTCLDNLGEFFDKYYNSYDFIHWLSSPSIGRQQICTHWTNWLTEHSNSIKHMVHHPGSGNMNKSNLQAGRHIFHRGCSLYTYHAFHGRMSTLADQLTATVRFSTIPHEFGLLASKLFLAYLSDTNTRLSSLTDEEYCAVEKLVPWTRVLHLLPPDEHRKILYEKNQYVLKKADSYRAMDVFIGSSLTQDEWAQVFDRAVNESKEFNKNGAWLVQERIVSKPLKLYEYCRYGVKLVKRELTMGTFIFGGKISGFLTSTTNRASHGNMPVFMGHIIVN